MLINEFLPNPSGPDTAGEFIELFNDAPKDADLGGWVIKDASGKQFILKNAKLRPGEYLVLKYADTKISLNNNGEKIFLYNSAKRLVDELGYEGAAPENYSLIRANDKAVFSARTTPGGANVFKEGAPVAAASADIFSPAGSLDGGNVLFSKDINFNAAPILTGFFISAVLALLFMSVYRKLNDL